MDLEKGIKTEAAIGASDDAQIPLMARGNEKELPISDLCVVPAVTDGAVVTAANMNPGKNNKSLRCWLVVTAVGMFLINHILAAPKYQLMIPLEPMVIFTMFMCAIFFLFHTIKQM